MLLVENDGNKIYVFGRNADGTTYCNIDYEFKPYFYVDDSCGEYMNIFGKPVKKINVDNPTHVKFLREKYDDTYESKVSYTNRYIIDKYHDKDIPEELKRICYFDIECEMLHDFDVYKALNKITSICCYDTFLK